MCSAWEQNTCGFHLASWVSCTVHSPPARRNKLIMKPLGKHHFFPAWNEGTLIPCSSSVSIRGFDGEPASSLTNDGMLFMLSLIFLLIRKHKGHYALLCKIQQWVLARLPMEMASSKALSRAELDAAANRWELALPVTLELCSISLAGLYWASCRTHSGMLSIIFPLRDAIPPFPIAIFIFFLKRHSIFPWAGNRIFDLCQIVSFLYSHGAG